MREIDKELFLSAACGHIKTMDNLVKEGADVSVVFSGDYHFNNHVKLGYSPLITATSANQLLAIEFLVRHGADVNATCGYSLSETFTALTMAVMRGYEDCAQYLINKGAHVNANNDDKCTALMRLAIQNNPDHFQSMAELLIRNGADINCRDMHGNTPLSSIASRFFSHSVENMAVLLNFNANHLLTNNEGKTAMDVAVDNNNINIVNLLSMYHEKHRLLHMVENDTDKINFNLNL